MEEDSKRMEKEERIEEERKRMEEDRNKMDMLLAFFEDVRNESMQVRPSNYVNCFKKMLFRMLKSFFFFVPMFVCYHRKVCRHMESICSMISIEIWLIT